MKIRSLITSLIILACAGTTPVIARGPNSPLTSLTGVQNQVTVAVLSAEEADTLLWMREEEKLARDIYLKLHQRWKKPVFQRIASSEQRHFEAIGNKIDLYGLIDPALPGLGQFTDAELQDTYDQLLMTGMTSYIKALTVGATIEDMDISDLQAAIEGTGDTALRNTYQNLLDGSKNHLRAFVQLLRGLGVDYTPQYIDALSFDAIVGV